MGDGTPGALDVDESTVAARQFVEFGCDLVTIVPRGPIEVGAIDVDGSSSLYSHWIRNEVGVPTLSADRNTSKEDLDTKLATGRAALCLLTSSEDRPVEAILQE